MQKKIGVRLPKFFNIVKIFATGITILLAAAIYFFPDYSEFVLNRKLLTIVLIGLTAANAIFYIFIAPFAKRKIALYINNIIWALANFGIMYTTGGVHSPFIIALIFPIITTAFDLEARAARVMGGLVAVLLLLQLFGDTRFPHTKSYYTLGFSSFIILMVITYYIYTIIKGTLRQKYEKEEAARKYSDLLEADKVKSEFITIASHQLRTPLSELKWSIATIEENKAIPSDAQKLIAGAKISIEKIIKVSDSMLLASEQTQDQFRYNPSPLNLVEILNETIKELEEVSVRRGVTMKFEAYSEKIMLLCDRQKIRFVFTNIIDNAIRYSPNGNINISLKETPKEAVVSVADTGIGIPEDQKNRIFTKLFRARNAILLEPNETGLGLFVAKNIIEKHGGKIWFESKEGKGTTFFVSLPKS